MFFFFSFSNLNMLSHCLLASMVSDMKSAINFIDDSLYVTNHFYFPAFRFSLAFYSLIIMCLGVYLFRVFLGVPWASWTCRFMYFVKFGTFSTNISSDSLTSLFSSFFGTPTCLCQCFDGVPQISYALLIFLHSVFFSEWIVSFDLSISLLILSLACSDLLLKPTSEFFYFSYMFQLQNYISLQ